MKTTKDLLSELEFAIKQEGKENYSKGFAVAEKQARLNNEQKKRREKQKNCPHVNTQPLFNGTGEKIKVMCINCNWSWKVAVVPKEAIKEK